MKELEAPRTFRRPVAPEWLVWTMFVLFAAAILMIVAGIAYVAIGQWTAVRIAGQIGCGLVAIDGFLLLGTRPK